MNNKIFICFAAEDRYNIVEPVVYHLKNYGINVWYDRLELLMGDNRKEKNLIEGASECDYAIAFLSNYTSNSKCAMEELSIVKERYFDKDITVFPILYEISPEEIPEELSWIKELIFKEVTRSSGTREICNHIACKITGDLMQNYRFKHIRDFIDCSSIKDALPIQALLESYFGIDNANLNSRISLLYGIYLTVKCTIKSSNDPIYCMVSMIFERLFSETRLQLSVDYRELWLLENATCLLLNIGYCTESKI